MDAAVACCPVEVESDLSAMVTETITGTYGSSTKATIADADASFKWSEGDQIAVHVSNGNNHKYVITSGATSVAAASASFTVSYDAGYSRDAFAVFPSTIVVEAPENYGQSGATLDVKLPSGYTLAQVSGEAGETSPCPMIATNDPAVSGWTFYQLCSLLRLTVSNIPETAKRLEIDFDGKQVWGDFSIASPVTPNSSVISTTADADHDIITITKDGTDVVLGATSLVLNIPLPTGTYSSISIYAYDALTDGSAVLTITKTFSYTASSNKGVKKTAFPPGLFSVSATKKVIFAPGNLQYLGNVDGTGTWRFAEHQYDFMGDGPSSGTSYQGNVDYTSLGYTTYNTGSGSGTPTDADKIAARDLFGWGTSGYNDKYPYMTIASAGSYYSSSMVDDGANYDWGVYHSASGSSTNKITNGGNYSWRLFTAEEWAYIIARQGRVWTRSDYNEIKDLFASSTVMGVKGLILFPDNWDGSLDTSIKYGNASDAGYDKTICDAEKWAKFEEAGCVFLPAAHARSGVSMGSLNQGHYWASIGFSVLNNTEFRGGELEFGSSGTVTKNSTNDSVRYSGQSVRLIRDAE